MSERLAGKTAVVTGSTSGIGKGIALEFARQGARVVVTGRRRELGEAVVAEIKGAGGEASYFALDVSEQAQIEALARYVEDTYAGLDILVNNAGLPGAGRAGRLADPPGPLWDGSAEDLWDALYRAGLKGTSLCSKYLMPLLIASGHGSIINISSIHADRGLGMDAYAAIKGAIRSLSISMAVNYARDHVRVNAICPGAVIVERLAPSYQDPQRVETALRQSLTRLGRPQDIAHCAVYLASDEAEYVTGAVMHIDGGMHAKGAFNIPGSEGV
ncbi:MAG: SDR family NAD(P)-dependent oxidoreductase [Chloroflexota bacterium]